MSPSAGDRDRLAADLQDGLAEFNGVIPATDIRLAAWLADRLIALGWTRLGEERLDDVRRAITRSGDDVICHHASLAEHDAAIAKAYREDTDGPE